MAAVVAGYQKAGGLPGMQQPALPNLNMASRAGMQSGGSSTMYQQVCNLQQAAHASSSHPPSPAYIGSVARQLVSGCNPWVPSIAGLAFSSAYVQSLSMVVECRRRH